MSWSFFFFGAFAAFVVSRFSPLSVRTQHRLLSVMPGIMALGCLLTRWINGRSAGFFVSSYFYKCYFAELDAAFVVSLAFGTAFTVDALRSDDRACRIIGWSFSPVYVGLLATAFWYIRGGFGLFQG